MAFELALLHIIHNTKKIIKWFKECHRAEKFVEDKSIKIKSVFET